MKNMTVCSFAGCAPSGPGLMQSAKFGAALTLGVMVLLAGCGSSSGEQPAVAGASSGGEVRGIVQLPLLASGKDFDDQMAAGISGDLSLEGGCLRVGSAPAVWPRGTTWNASTKTVSLPSGATLVLGSTVRAGGGYIHGAPLSDMFGDQVRAAAAACAGANTDVAVLNATPEPSAM